MDTAVRTAFHRTQRFSNRLRASSTGSVLSSRLFSGTFTTPVTISVATYNPSASATHAESSRSSPVSTVITPSSSGPPKTMENTG